MDTKFYTPGGIPMLVILKGHQLNRSLPYIAYIMTPYCQNPLLELQCSVLIQNTNQSLPITMLY